MMERNPSKIYWESKGFSYGIIKEDSEYFDVLLKKRHQNDIRNTSASCLQSVISKPYHGKWVLKFYVYT